SGELLTALPHGYLCGANESFGSPTSWDDLKVVPYVPRTCRPDAVRPVRTYVGAGLQARPNLTDDVEAHRTGRASDRFHCRFERVAIEIGHLQLCDLLDLLRRDGADLVLVRLR